MDIRRSINLIFRVWCVGQVVTVSGSPKISTTTCVVKTEWSTWYNRHTPSPDTDEIEGMSGAEKYAFCGSGTLLAVECQTINNIPFFSTGDFGTVCNITHGLVCSSTENFPVGCNDYMIRYQCQYCVCTIPIGIGNHFVIGASQITASSSMGIEHLKNKREATGIKLPWTPEQTDTKPWIQVDFLEPKTLSCVITLGSPYKEEWVTSYQVFTSMDGKTFVPYSDIENGNVPKTFEGNTDNKTEVTRLFNRNIVGRYVRFYPITWHVLPTLMFEILGCNPTEAVNITTVAPGGATGLAPTLTPPIGGSRTPTVSPPANSATPTPKFGETIAPPTQHFNAPPTVCLTPMGMEYYGTVLDKQISSSSALNVTYGATSGRIYGETAWIPRSNDTSPWIQINFEKPKLLSCVQTQGENNGERWVTRYTVDFSMDGITYYPYADKLGATQPKNFTANHNSFDVERHLFNRNVTAQYIRIHPLAWHGSLPALRLNVLGCNPDNPLIPTIAPPTGVTPAPNASSGSPTTPGGVVTGTTNGYEGISTIPGLTFVPPSLCDVPMGIENHLIVQDRQLSASSSKDQFTGAERARLYSEKGGSFSGGWVAGENNLKQYIQVDFLAPYYLGGIVTQGRADANQWVTRYEVYYSTDGRHYSAIPKSYLDSSPMVFTGNSDKNTPVAHKFQLISARWIRIHPVEWHGAIAMRFNVLGCMSPSRSPITTITAPTPTPTVSGPKTTLTGAGSTACAYWTSWVSASKPDKQGEYESAWQLRELITFCDYQYITRTECRTTGTHIQYDQAGESGLICNNELKGLLCYAQNQTDLSCLDYEIRMFCDECSSPTTPSVTMVTPEVCNPKWLPWINTMVPTTDMNYVEHEFMSVAEQRELCPHGKLTRIECVTTSGIQYYSTGSVGTTCDVTRGLSCRNSDNYPIGCEDFKVRYYCECEGCPTNASCTILSGPYITNTRSYELPSEPSSYSGDDGPAFPSFTLYVIISTSLCVRWVSRRLH